MNKKRVRTQKGFTLLEILLAVAAMVILASIVILAINPGKQLADTRNAQRWSDVNTILNAVYQYAIDNNGTFPAGITTTAGCLVATSTSGVVCSSGINLTSALVPGYLVNIPADPKATSTTNYNIVTNSDGRVTVSVPAGLQEQDKGISVTR